MISVHRLACISMIMVMEYWKIMISTTTCTLVYKSGNHGTQSLQFVPVISVCVCEDSIASVANIC